MAISVPARLLACALLAAVAGWPPLAACALAGCTLAGCTIEGAVGRDDHPVQVVADVPDRFRDKLDLLFVVDNGADASGLAAEVVTAFDRMYEYLMLVESADLDLHVGVVSSDLGSGVADIGGCTADGDRGALRGGDDGRCAALVGRWLELRQEGTTYRSNVADFEPGADIRVALGEVIACMSRLTPSRCGYPQPLAAMQRALDPTAEVNPGFLRDGAALGVVMVAGRDDCSVRDPSFYPDPEPREPPGPAQPPGPVIDPTYRCFDHGVSCRRDDVDSAIGPQHNCLPSTQSELTDVTAPVQFLRKLRPDDALVSAGVVGADRDIVVVRNPDDSRALAPACQRPGATVYPTVRLQGFLEQMPHHTVAPICDDGAESIASTAGAQLRRALGHRCLSGHLHDISDAPGMQPDCTVTAVGADGTRHGLTACRRPNNPLAEPGPCFAIRPGACPDFADREAVWVNWGEGRGFEAPLGTRTEVACAVEDP